MKLFLRRLLGAIARPLSPGYGHCRRCKRPWKIAKYHATKFSNHSSCFVLCESCWQDLAIIQRLPYYLELLEQWRSYGGDDDGTPWDDVWAAIEKAVIDGR